MSIQTLLPKDVLVRQLSICFEDDEIPSNYVSDRGRVKERNADTMRNSFLNDFLGSYLRDAKPYMLGRSIGMTKYDCNFTVWKVISKLLSIMRGTDKFYLDRDTGSDALEASSMTSLRLGLWVTKSENQQIRDTYDEQLPVYNEFMSMAIYLEELRDLFSRANREKLNSWTRGGSMGTFEPADPYSTRKHIKYYQVGSLVILRIRSTRRGEEGKFSNFVMTNTHYSRVIDYLKSCSILSIYLPDINGIDTSFESLLSLADYQVRIALKTPNGVGSVFKTARQILFLRGDKSKIMGGSADSLFISGLSGVKLKYGEEVADHLFELTGDRKSALNLANIFRMVPHPDAEMEEVFESIKGFTDPNTIKESSYSRFEGYVRRTVYQSLVAQRMDVRAVANADGNSMVDEFVSSINATSTPVADLMNRGYFYWSSIEFQEVRGLFDHNKQDIPVSNKASAPNSNMSREQINSIGGKMKLSEYKSIRKRLKALNDVATVLAGTDELDFIQARKRFRSVVAEHEKFESEYLSQGIKIDDIPHEDLADFVIGNSEASYTVLTEPKLGEVHKEVTRLFYMAEQALKIMTQVTERAIKKVISKAAGVSIVKGFRARRKEIEEMLDAYSGFTFIEGDDGSLKVVYISFDMSEFSKKFPQKLVRAIGKVLGELTGEDWMSRIDVFFRASVVYHNTRGYLGVQAGAKGGFEGFLNFIWTLAMKVVMDVATEATGVEGVLAVYSDDGLLRLYMSGDKRETSLKIMKIKKVFANHGLIFHLDKTAVSHEIMEYLGLYGDRGMLIPTWIKEVMSVGKRKQTPGLETTYDKVTLWDSQCNAVIKAQGPPYPSMLVKTLLTIQTLRRLNRIISPKILACLTIIPSSAGGFRVSSISESNLLSSIEGVSEFAADLELMSHSDPFSSNAIANAVYDNLKPEKEAEKRILTGSFLQTKLIDTSGLGLAAKLVEDACIDESIQKNPLTPSRIDSILRELRSSTNFSHRMIKELISSIPEVIKYNKSLALMKSTAALKFVTRDKIKHAQRSDTRKCIESITYWGETITEFDGRVSVVGARRFLDFVKLRMYPSYRFASFKDSPRISLIPCDSDPDIIASFETTERGRITSQTYIEPKYKGLGAQLTPEIEAETSFNTEKRMRDRFVSSAARIVSTNTSLINLYYIIANAFQLPCPSLPAVTSVGMHKSARNFSYGGVHVILPAPYHALVNSRIGHKLYNRLRSIDKRDRTTFTEASRIAGYLRASNRIRNKIILPVYAESYLYNLRDWNPNTSNPELVSFSSPNESLVEGKVTKMFSDLILEEKAQADMLHSIISTNGLIECIRDKPIVKGILLSRLTSWLRTTISSDNMPKSVPFRIPDPWLKEIVIEAAIEVSFRTSPANIVRMIQRSMNNFLIMTRMRPSGEFREVDEINMELNNALNNRRNSFDIFNDRFREIIRPVSRIGLDERTRNELFELTLYDNDVMECFISFLKRKSVTGGIEVPTVVINTNTFADTKMSREVKNKIKTLVDSVLCSFLEIAVVARNDDFEHDSLINLLHILKNMLRPSGHRQMPFNNHMVTIQYVKYEIFLSDLLERGIKEVSIDDLTNYRLDRDLCWSIREQNNVIGGRSEYTSGSDMQEELMDKGILKCMLARTNYILRNMGYDQPEERRYKGSYISKNNIMHGIGGFGYILTSVREDYNFYVKKSVEKFRMVHSRDADIVTNLTVMTPYDEVALLAANTQNVPLQGIEFDISLYYGNQTYNDLIANLLLTHQARWSVPGFNAIKNLNGSEVSDTELNTIIRTRGIFGNKLLALGDIHRSSLTETIIESDYYLHCTTYEEEEYAIHNYIYINRLDGGMAVIGKDGLRYILLGVIPKGTRTIGTESLSVPEYFNEFRDKPPIYALEVANQNLKRIAGELGMRPDICDDLGEAAAVMIKQTYQRLVGAAVSPEDEDTFLVAMAEMAKGSWTSDIGLKLLTMFAAWMSSEGPVSKQYYKDVVDRFRELAKDDTYHPAIAVSMSSCWEWLRLTKISAGPNMDTNEIGRILASVDRHGPRGGFPSAIINLIPKSLVSVKQRRGEFTIDGILLSSQSALYSVPERNRLELMDDQFFDALEDEGDSDDEW